jgi:hypothetical protein
VRLFTEIKYGDGIGLFESRFTHRYCDPTRIAFINRRQDLNTTD